jgi:D-beta-D-heptose 7-phosphate kinase/D-beta-D-heptose 1-phosphate adenosyltransferase
VALSTQTFDEHIATFKNQVVLCVGDLMLDEFHYGRVARISPEAPTPVIAVDRCETMIGAAGNVARNIVCLGARCVLIGILGEDEAARLLIQGLAKEPSIETYLVVDRTRPTTRKVRFVSEHHSTHLLRADWEQDRPIEAALEKSVLDRALAALPHVQSVVLSDYAKGVLTPEITRSIIEAARKLGIPVVVGPKGTDYSGYRGATLVTPNRKELADVTRRPVMTRDEVEAAASELARTIGCDAVLVTLSEDGMMLVEPGSASVYVPAYPVRVRDVSGAGDTVAATLSILLAAGVDREAAMRAANAAASVVVGKRGIATVSVPELRSRILPSASLAPEEKIVHDWSVLDDRLAEWRQQGLRIGFTNGCFDLLHPGHIRLLTEARGACDYLIVGLNSDASVKRLKGEGRPVQEQQARAEVLASIEAVDQVVIFEDDTPLELIGRVRPKVLVKGADYRIEEVVGRDLVESYGGEVVLVNLVPGFSTSALVQRSARPPGPPEPPPAKKTAASRPRDRRTR